MCLLGPGSRWRIRVWSGLEGDKNDMRAIQVVFVSHLKGIRRELLVCYCRQLGMRLMQR